jgi:hypothetical protein
MSHNTLKNIHPERFKDLTTRVIINAWDTFISTNPTNETRSWPLPEHINRRVLCHARTGSLLAYIGSQDSLRERDMGESAVRERDIGETVATWWFAEQLNIHLYIQPVSSCLSFSQTWHCMERVLRRQNPKILQLTEGMSLQHAWWGVRLRDSWLCGRGHRFWLWGMLPHHLASLR